MPSVYEILHVGLTNETVNVDTLDRTQIRFQGSELLDSGVNRSKYELANGDSETPLQIEVDSIFDPRARGGVGETRYTIRMSTTELITEEGVSEPLWKEPVTVGLFIRVGGRGFKAQSLYMKSMLSNLFALTYKTVTTNEGDVQVLDDLSQFFTEELWTV